MKKILSIAALLISLSVSAQGNLQFNQVITEGGNLSAYNTIVYSPNYTVPAGKVWKVEYVGFSPSVNTGANRSGIVSINGQNSEILVGGNAQFEFSGPIWLKSSDNLRFGWKNIYSSTNTCAYVISIIEFNVVP